MPILDLQMRQRELGRIRIGKQVPTGTEGKSRPAKLDTFRFTSASQELIEQIASLYGGTCAPWSNDGLSQFEVFTTSNRVPILLPPQPISQWYEMWSGGGCQRRCDGVKNVLAGDKPCECPSDPIDRAELASKGRACKPTTRLNVVLRDVPGIGVWRLESHGFHSAVELPMVAEFLAQATAAGTYLPADLALAPRFSKRPGVGRRDWLVPIIEVGATPSQLMSGEGLAGIGSGRKAALGGDRKAIESAKPVDLGVAHYRGLADDAETVGALTQALRAAQTVGHAREGDALFKHFVQRRREIESGVVVAEIVESADQEELDELWAQALENAGDMDSRQLQREFAARNNGLHPQSANAEQLREFLAHLRAGSAVAA